ncbi:hypothetical protein [Entomospira culicis]|uniref:Uncharacterized protein n=1 Tax=Entomospira culicis TaxID=2719989 RepID=A0A968GFY6_9SPIO|nr:hypothetical protein [Entomospira culicis]NIZ19513.1 hypothetical protein [Entomospira culicis]NIZ69582.1 hypothetical protein [Entomospira culicis]WDI36693.1 hypothetical protein PVA46_05045 [Entomospira culicis]WDI38322.1 hypothetical protein PVA47_05055 [Entomospira culicis]
MESQEKKGDDGYWLGIVIILVAIIMGIIPVFANFMPKPVDVTKLTFEKPIMVPYMVDGVEVDKQAELKLNEDALREFIASETDRHNHYLTVVSIMMALFGIFGSVVAIGMGISLSLKERGIDQQLKEYKTKIEQEAQIQIDDIVVSANNRLNEINQEKDTMFYYYVLENMKPALVREGFVSASDDTIQEDWREARIEFEKLFRYGYGDGDIVERLTKLTNDIESKLILNSPSDDKSINRHLIADVLVMRMYIGDDDFTLCNLLLERIIFIIADELTLTIFYPPLMSVIAKYVLGYQDMYKVATENNDMNNFKKLDKTVALALNWLEDNNSKGRSQQELLAVNAIYKKVKAEVVEREPKR